MSCRKNWARLSTTEKEKYIAAVLVLKNTTPSVLFPASTTRHRYDDYVALHRNAMAVFPSWAHNAPAFFSWHRELIRHFEMDLQAIDPSVSVPYWDWLVDQSQGLPIWDPNPLSGLGTNGRAADRQVMDGAFAFAAGQWTVRVKDNPADPDFLRRNFTDGGAEVLTTIAPSGANIGDQARALSRLAYDSAPWLDIDSSFNWVRPNAALNVLRVGTEYDLHNLVHRWVSGNMFDASSPNDPVFWLHHCNIDRIWALWQRQHPTAAAYLPNPPTAGVPVGHRSDEALIFTDATNPTAPWTGATTSASTVNHHLLSPGSYWYDTDPPEVISRTNSIEFLDVPQGVGGAGVTTYRAVVLEVVPGPCNPIRLEVTAGPTAGFGTPLGAFVDIPPSESAIPVKGRLWLSYSSSSGTIAGGSVTVTATSRESGGAVVWADSWTVNISANSIPRPKAAVALVLDRSGSMSLDSGDGLPRIDKVREAVGIFTDVMVDGDGLAIVRFDDQVDLLMGVTNVGPMPAVAGSGRATAAAILTSSSAATTLDPRGMTSIGGGVAAGKQALDSAPLTAPPYSVLAMLVLTDGLENTPPMIADVEATGITANTFAIGFGTSQSVSTTALNRLTQNNEGYLLLTGAIGPSEQFLLSKYFLQILAGINNQQIVLDPVGQLIYGTQHRIPFIVTEADFGADIILLSPAPAYVDFTLETPDGSIIKPSTAAAEPAVSFVKGKRVNYYSLALPALSGSASGSHAGQWHAILEMGKAGQKANREFVAQQRGRALSYSLLVHAYSSLTLRASLQQSGFEPGATVMLLASLREYDVPVERRAQVWAEVTRPDGTTMTVVLQEAAGGAFSASFDAKLTGLYRARIQAKGTTFHGMPFAREQTLTASVFPGGDRVVDPGVRELIRQLADRDERLCQLLQCVFEGGAIDKALEKRLRALGFDTRALRECLKRYCEKSDRELTEASVSRESERRLVALRNLRSAPGAGVKKRAVRAGSKQAGFVEMEKAEPIKPVERVPMPKGMSMFPSLKEAQARRGGHHRSDEPAIVPDRAEHGPTEPGGSGGGGEGRAGGGRKRGPKG